MRRLIFVPLWLLLIAAGQAHAQDGGTDAATPDATPDARANPQTADEAFVTRVKSLEEQISDLKEKILLSKSRLQTLQEKVLGGDLSSGANVVLLHKKELSSTYTLVSISYALDGTPIKTRVDNAGDLNKAEEFEVFNGPISPGNHTLAVQMVLKGGTRGVFSYAKDYQFRVASSFTFNAEAGKLTQLNIVAFEKGGFTAKFEEKPGFRFETHVTSDRRTGARGGASSLSDGK